MLIDVEGSHGRRNRAFTTTVESAPCDGCGKSGIIPLLLTDGSDDEYASTRLCKSCVIELFDNPITDKERDKLC